MLSGLAAESVSRSTGRKIAVMMTNSECISDFRGRVVMFWTFFLVIRQEFTSVTPFDRHFMATSKQLQPKSCLRWELRELILGGGETSLVFEVHGVLGLKSSPRASRQTRGRGSKKSELPERRRRREICRVGCSNRFESSCTNCVLTASSHRRYYSMMTTRLEQSERQESLDLWRCRTATQQ